MLVTSEGGQLSDLQLDPARGTMYYISSSNGSSGSTSSRWDRRTKSRRGHTGPARHRPGPNSDLSAGVLSVP